MSSVYVTHTCRNKRCEMAFIAEDTNNAQNYPPTSKYCDECVALGYTNKKRPTLMGKQGTANLEEYRKDKAEKKLLQEEEYDA